MDVIEVLVCLYKPTSYLELGVEVGRTFKRIEQLVPKTIAVDIKKMFVPQKGTFFLETTTKFFERNKDEFDMIFIDAGHAINYVRYDLENSLKILSSNGVLILHDTNPEEMSLTLKECLDAYKIVDEIDTDKYFTFTFPTDNSGMTILTLKTNRRCLEFV